MKACPRNQYNLNLPFENRIKKLLAIIVEELFALLLNIGFDGQSGRQLIAN